MLAGQGFSRVINMSGGIKAWENNVAFGPEDAGMTLFSGKEDLKEVLLVAYALEAGLQEFYSVMPDRVEQPEVKELFRKLREIERKHQDRIFNEYKKIVGDRGSREEFERETVVQALEGGLTVEEYLSLYPTDFQVIEEVVSLAMGIEAQALDLYQRAAGQASREDVQQALFRIAEEERVHLTLLGELLD